LLITIAATEAQHGLGVTQGISMNADEQAIRSLVGQWHTATAAGQVEVVLRLMSEDVVFLVTGQPAMRGRSTFEKGLLGLLASHTVESTYDIQEVDVSGDLAYCWTVLDVRVTSKTGGNTARRTGSALTLLRRQGNGSWVVVRDANLLALTP
jgi:uncharacterized protein (TIGR02246 family)